MKNENFYAKLVFDKIDFYILYHPPGTLIFSQNILTFFSYINIGMRPPHYKLFLCLYKYIKIILVHFLLYIYTYLCI